MTSKIIELLSDQHSPNLNIVDQILVNLGIAEIFALNATCRSLRWLMRHMTESPYLLNIDRHLRRFSNNPTHFRYALGKCDGLIRGAFVRSFLAFDRPASSTLVITLEQGSRSEAFVEYLKTHEGYRLWGLGGGRTRVYTRPTHPDVSIHISPAISPIVDIINRAQTSTDLVFISWNKIYCLLPLPTIKRHKFFVFKPFDIDMNSTLREYTASGWTMRDLIWPGEARGLTPREALQQIGGQRSLIINLSKPPRGEFTPDRVLENNVFSLHWSNGFSDGRQRLIVGALLIDEKPTLRYMHTTGRAGVAQASWKKFLEKKLADWENVQILKVFHELDPNFCRSTWYTCPVCQSPVTSAWDYADEHISTWFQEWRKQEAKLALLPLAPKYSS